MIKYNIMDKTDWEEYSLKWALALSIIIPIILVYIIAHFVIKYW